MTTLKASFAFLKMAAADLLSRASAIYAGMNNNPAYPNPPVDLPTFKAAIDGYSSAIAESLDGGKKAKAELRRQGEVLIKILRQLAHYVEAACKDDMTIFTSSGFQAQATARIPVLPLSESIRKIDPGNNSGELEVTIVADPAAYIYELRWAPVVNGTPGTWTSQPVVSTRPPTLVGSLTPGTIYAFQVRALTKTGYTDWSDSVNRMCT